MSNPGRKNRKIQIWASVEDPVLKDKLGQPLVEDKCIKSIMAEIIPQTGSLLTSRPADTVLSKSTHKIIIWYNPHFKIRVKKNWIMYKDHRFEIDYILNPNFGNVDLEIFCQEICNGSGF